MTTINPIQLLNVTGREPIDSIMRDFIYACENAFPQKILSYTLLGSQLDNTETINSDLDIGVVFTNETSKEELDRFDGLVAQLDKSVPFELGAKGILESFFQPAVPLFMKKRMLLYGQDVIQTVPVMTNARVARRFLRGSFRLLQMLYGSKELSYPLGFPDISAEFYGYQHKLHYDVPITKWTIATVARMAATILALQADMQPDCKRDAFLLYAKHVGGEWASYVETIYSTLNQRWQYAIPETAAEQAELNNLYQQFPAFGNYFLDCCRPMIVDYLQHEDAEKRAWAEGSLNLITL